jgi:hypothetical protein
MKSTKKIPNSAATVDGAQYENISSPQKSSDQRKQPETTTVCENYPVTP